MASRRMPGGPAGGARLGGPGCGGLLLGSLPSPHATDFDTLLLVPRLAYLHLSDTIATFTAAQYHLRCCCCCYCSYYYYG